MPLAAGNIGDRAEYDAGRERQLDDQRVEPEAVSEARVRFADTLVFGGDVADGLLTVVSDAGPPEKIYSHLSDLAYLTEKRRSGPLGSTVPMCLADRGVDCSGEAPGDRNNPKSRQARTWDDGCGGKRYFDSHLKPNEGTGPDRCVRIYFEYDEQLQMTIVGWVGRHP